MQRNRHTIRQVIVNTHKTQPLTVINYHHKRPCRRLFRRFKHKFKNQSPHRVTTLPFFRTPIIKFYPRQCGRSAYLHDIIWLLPLVKKAKNIKFVVDKIIYIPGLKFEMKTCTLLHLYGFRFF